MNQNEGVLSETAEALFCFLLSGLFSWAVYISVQKGEISHLFAAATVSAIALIFLIVGFWKIAKAIGEAIRKESDTSDIRRS